MVTEITKWGYPEPTPFVPLFSTWWRGDPKGLPSRSQGVWTNVARGTLKDSATVAGGEVDSARPPSVCSARIGALPHTFAYAGPPTPPHIRARPTGGGRVPVTARLSKRFYDVFGEEIANELVNWFNQVDDTYRGDLRELNELNFSRFDAKLEQRLAELRSNVAERLADLESRLTWR